MGKAKNLLITIGLVLAGLGALHAGALTSPRPSPGGEGVLVSEMTSAFAELPTLKLRQSGATADKCEQLRDAVAVTYTSQIGVTESLGANDSREIREYLKVTGFDQPVAWCAAFVSWTFTQHDVYNPKSAWSPTWFPRERVIYSRQLAVGSRQKPERADVFGIYFSKYKRIAHVGFVDAWPDGDYFITVEGNTNGLGSRDGDGVYRKRRPKAVAYKISRWISCRHESLVHSRESIVLQRAA